MKSIALVTLFVLLSPAFSSTTGAQETPADMTYTSEDGTKYYRNIYSDNFRMYTQYSLEDYFNFL